MISLEERYRQFHTRRRLELERLTAERFAAMIAEGFSASGTVHKDALFYAYEQLPSEETQMIEFGLSIIHDCISILENNTDRHRREYFSALLKDHYGINDAGVDHRAALI